MFLSVASRARNRGGFPSGTQMMFVNAAAPRGWTRVSTFDDALLRIVGSAAPGSGGSNGFVATVNSQTGTGTGTTGTGTTGTGTTGTNNTGTGTTGTGTSGGTATTIAQEAAHTHSLGFGAAVNYSPGSCATQGQASTGSAGSGSTHTHSVPGLSVPALSIPGLSVPGLSVPGLTVPSLSVTFGIKYVDALIAKKN